MTPPTLADLVDAIYDAVLHPPTWSTVLRDLASAVQGERPVLFGHDVQRRAGVLNLALDVDSRTAREYDEYYGARNVWLTRGQHLLKSGTVRTSQMMCPQDELLRSEFYNDYLKPLDSTHGLGATIWHEGAYTYNLCIMRARRAASFDGTEIRFLEALMPHLQRSIQIHRQLSHLSAQERAQAEALNCMPAALLLVDQRRRVIFANRAAEGILAAGDGLSVVDGRLSAHRAQETRRLDDLIRRAATSRAAGNPAAGGIISVTRRSHAPHLSVVVTSLAIGGDFLMADPPVAAVFVFDRETPLEAAHSLLIRLHGLTRAEAGVVGRLVAGESVEAAADRLAISVHTARTHLKRALGKTGTNRQAELIRLVLTGPAALLLSDAFAAESQHGTDEA